MITAGYSTPGNWIFPVANPRVITAVVWHSMEGWLPGAIATWNSGVSGAHLSVTRDGRIFLNCAINNIAWHAGTDNNTGRTAFWKRNNINTCSIGVELEGFAASGFTPEQEQACVKIMRWAKARYNIPLIPAVDMLTGHLRHSAISNQRSDPGVLFPLGKLLIEAGGFGVDTLES